MKKSLWAMVLLVALVVGTGAGFAGHKIEDVLDQQYHNGVAFLEGSKAFPAATGTAVFETTPKGAVLKLQVLGVPDLANTTLDIKIAPPAVGLVKPDAVLVGTITIGANGSGIATIAANAVKDFPAIADGFTITLKTPANVAVAEGVFGAP